MCLGVGFQNCNGVCWACASRLPPYLSQHPGTPLSSIIGNLLPDMYSEQIGSSYFWHTFLRILGVRIILPLSFPITDRSPHFPYMFICLQLVENCSRCAEKGLLLGLADRLAGTAVQWGGCATWQLCQVRDKTHVVVWTSLPVSSRNFLSPAPIPECRKVCN